jgi:hypothetical protein
LGPSAVPKSIQLVSVEGRVTKRVKQQDEGQKDTMQDQEERIRILKEVRRQYISDFQK